jgi:NADPH2:quinone reductase
MVHGGAGGVGSAAIQIALGKGARVIGTDFGPKRRRFCQDLGAHLAVDPEVEDLVAAVNDFTAGRGADVVIDTVGGDLFDDSRRCVAFEGRIVVVGFTSGRIPQLQVNRLILRNFTVMGINAMAYQLDYPQIHGRVRQNVIDMCLREEISPAIHCEAKLDELPALFVQLDHGEVLGKAVIKPAP